MVVVTHSAGLFHFLAKPAIMDLPLAQGVSFFFVLSGFILTYNYPKLNGVENTLKFLASPTGAHLAGTRFCTVPRAFRIRAETSGCVRCSAVQEFARAYPHGAWLDSSRTILLLV